MRASLAVALVLVTGCPGSGPQKLGTQPSWRNAPEAAKPAAAPAAPLTLAPTTPAAQRYNEPFQAAPSTPLGDAVVAAVRDAAGRAGVAAPVADARLFRACEELAAIVPDDGVIPSRVVEFALQRHGIVEPVPRLIVWRSEDVTAGAVVDELQPQLASMLTDDGPFARVGFCTGSRRADGLHPVLLALQGSGVSTSPIPRALPARGAFTLDAVVDARFKDPEVFVTREDGATERLAATAGHAGGFTSNVACGAHTGRQQVEITADSASGPTVLANFPVWCGTAPPVAITVEPSADDAPAATTEEAERRLFAMINRDRAAQHLPPLAWDDQVAAVSRAHSLEMMRTKNVAHVSPTTGAATDRVRAANIRTGLVLENIVRARSVAEAHDGLMNSPGHRANLMSPSATDVGIGVVFGEPQTWGHDLFVTEVFTRVPPAIVPARAAEQVVAKARAAQPVGNNPRLAAIAQQMAAIVATGTPREQAYAKVQKQVDALGELYARVGSTITVTADLDTLDGAQLLGDARPDDIGVGVAQGPHPELGANAIWVVVMLAQKR
jgi:uncharacterized protein YkwD